MMKYFSILLLIILSCGSKDLSKYYYTFDDTSFPEKRVEALNYSALIENFTTSSWLRTRNIPVRPSPNRIDYYDEYGWISPPGELFAEYTYAIIKSANLFSSLYGSYSESNIQYQIEGKFNHLEFLHKEDSVYAWIDFSIQCSNIDDRTIAAEHSFSDRILMDEDPTAQRFASICTEIFHREIILFAEKCEGSIGSK